MKSVQLDGLKFHPGKSGHVITTLEWIYFEWQQEKLEHKEQLLHKSNNHNSLDLAPYKCSNITNINETTSKFDNQISTKKIKEHFPDTCIKNQFCVEVSQDDAKIEFSYLNIKKSLTSSRIPATILKGSIEIHLSFMKKTL